MDLQFKTSKRLFITSINRIVEAASWKSFICNSLQHNFNATATLWLRVCVANLTSITFLKLKWRSLRLFQKWSPMSSWSFLRAAKYFHWTFSPLWSNIIFFASKVFLTNLTMLQGSKMTTTGIPVDGWAKWVVKFSTFSKSHPRLAIVMFDGQPSKVKLTISAPASWHFCKHNFIRLHLCSAAKPLIKKYPRGNLNLV